jgi:hypothetical protein
MCARAAVIALLSQNVRRLSVNVRPKPCVLSAIVRPRTALLSRPRKELIEPLQIGVVRRQRLYDRLISTWRLYLDSIGIFIFCD